MQLTCNTLFENGYDMVKQDGTDKTYFQFLTPHGCRIYRHQNIINAAFHIYQKSSLFPLQTKLSSFLHSCFAYGIKHVYLDISVMLIVFRFTSAFILMQFCFNYCQNFIYFNVSIVLLQILIDQANISLFKGSNRNTRKRCKICSQSTIKTPERLQ